MWRFWIKIAVLGAAVLCVAACSSAPAPCDDEIAERPVEESSMEAVEAFEVAAPWLMVESSVVAVGVDPASWHFLGDVLLPTADPTAEPGSPGTLEALKGDLEELFMDSFGFDPGRTDAWVVGGSLQGGTAVLFGDFDETEEAERFEVGELEGFKIDMRRGAFNDVEAGDWVYALPIDEPHAGMVLSMELEKLERLESALESEEPGRNLAVGERAAVYRELFGELGAPTLSVASTVSDIAGFVGESERAPDAAALGYDPAGVRIVLEGKEETLQEIDERVSEKIDDYRQRMEDSYEDEEERDFFDEYVAIYGYHVFESVARQLEPEYDDGRMRFEVAIDDLGWGSGLMMASAVFAGLWQGWSEVDDWGVDPWAPRPSGRETVEKKVAAAAEYYRSEQTYCGDLEDCDHPWHSDGEPGEPVGDDERVFPGGPGIELVTMHTIPVDGEEADPDPVFVEKVEKELEEELSGFEIEGEEMPVNLTAIETEVVEYDFEARKVLDILGYDYQSPREFRITYETGPGVGTEARVTITAEADFDIDELGHHRVYQTLEVGEDGGLIYHDPVVDDEAE